MFELWFERFNSLSNGWAAWMATATIEALIVLLVVGTIWLLIRWRVAPQVGVWLFLLVPLKLLIPIQVPAPALIADWTPAAIVAKLTLPQTIETEPLPPAAEIRTFAQSQHRRAFELNNGPILPAVTLDQPEVALPLSVETIDVASVHAASSIPAASDITAPSKLSLNLVTLLMFTWAMAVSFLGLRFLYREIRFRRQLRSATRLANKDLKFDFQTLCQSAGVHRPVRLLCSEAVIAPAVHGILRPSIILPTSAIELSPAQLSWAVLHELSHIRRHDLAFILLQRVVSWLFFFHPAIWIAHRIVHQLREFACDDWAILQTETAQHDCCATDAGEAFLQILRSASEHSRSEIALSVLGLGPRKSCQQRLQRMLDTDRRIQPGLGWVSICGLLLTAAVMLPQLSAASPQGPIAETNGALAETKTIVGEAEAWRFDLSVIDTKGEAVPSATVYLDSGNTPTSDQIRIGKYIKTSRKGDAFVCNNQGKLSIDFATKPKQLQILFEMDGYGPYLARWVQLSQVNQMPHKFTAQVERAWTIGGTVIDEDGNSVKDAEIRFSIKYKQRPGLVNYKGKFNRIKTDEQGRWVLRQVPDSLYSVDADINQSAFQVKSLKLVRPKFEIPQGGGDQFGGTVTLSRGLTVSGRIVDEQGKAIVGATVRTLAAYDERRAISGEDGRYTIVGCQPKTIDVVATSPGTAIELHRVTVEAKSKDVDFVLKPSIGIRVRFVDKAGKPLSGLRILPVTWRGSATTHWALNQVLLNRVADENGVWEWKEAPLDEVAVAIGSPRSAWEETPLDEFHVMRTPRSEVLGGTSTLLAREEEYVITVPTKSFMSGEVTDAVTGEKIKSFRVIPGRSVQGRRSWLGGDTIIGSDGTYRIPYTRGDHDAYYVRIEAAGYRSVVSRNVKSDEGEVALDFKLEPAEMTTTQVVDAEGLPVSQAVVVYATGESTIHIRNGYLNFSEHDNGLQFTTNDQGKVRFTTRLEPFQLVVLHDRGFTRVASEKMAVPQQIKLTEWSVLEGNYLVGQEPARGIDVLVEAKGLDVRRNRREGVPYIYVSYSGKTNSSGNFRFDRVVPGNNYVGHKKYAGVSHRSGIFKKYVAVAGETQKLHLGGSGVPIVGRMLPPVNYDGSKVLMDAQLSLTPQESTGDPEESNSDVFFKTTAEEDGSFRIDDVPAGNWILTSSHRILDGPDLISDPIKITIAGDDQGEKDIGDVPMSKRKRLGD